MGKIARYGDSVLLKQHESVRYYITTHSSPWDKDEVWYSGKIKNKYETIPYYYSIESENGEIHEVSATHVWGMGC